MKIVPAAVIGLLIASTPALACDPCALYSATRLSGHKAGAFTLSLNEQFTNFDRAPGRERDSLQNGEVVRDYSTTQLALGYDITEQTGVQLSLPVISRRFDEYTNYRSSDESETGIGDAALTASFTPLADRNPGEAWVLGLFGGVKLPTGDAGSLESEEPSSIARHHSIGGGSSGRALSLGSGSFDFPLGAYALARIDRAFVLASVQYTVRTEGDFDYEFADDTLWSAGPGWYVLLNDDYTLAARAVVSGESKGSDRHEGNLVDGSALSEIYAGPELIVTFGSLSAEFGFDVRTTGVDDDAVAVPDYRIRVGLNYRFG